MPIPCGDCSVGTCQQFGYQTCSTPGYGGSISCRNPGPISQGCTFNGQTVNSGSSITAYQSASVAQGQQCVSESRTCTNGALSGSYGNATCAVTTPELTPMAAAILVGFALLIGWKVRQNNGQFT